jgi:lsr operon transcriptional repressor
VAILGIGTCYREEGGGTFAKMLEQHGIPEDVLRRAGVVGEICNRPYDADGRDLSAHVGGLLDFVDGVEIEALKRLVEQNRKVIAVAGGTHKVNAIHFALKSRLVNYLITDKKTAEALLEKA